MNNAEVLLNDFKKKLKSAPLTSSFVDQIEILQRRYGKEYEEIASELLLMIERLGYDAKVISRKYAFDYLKQLDHFLKNGTYGHQDYSVIREQIYDNEETMMNTYMPGLLLSYAYTTILVEKNHVFLSDFLPEIKKGGKGIEIGFGEGFYLWEALRLRSDISVIGYDISHHAIKFAGKVLELNQIPGDRYSLGFGNITEGIEEEASSMDYGILAEVIEHIPDPKKGIQEMGRMLKPGAVFYLTTVIDSNHMDHITNFESPEAVEALIEEAGFQIIKRNCYKIKEDFPDSKDISIGLAFVAKRTEG